MTTTTFQTQAKLTGMSRPRRGAPAYALPAKLSDFSGPMFTTSTTVPPKDELAPARRILIGGLISVILWSVAGGLVLQLLFG